MEQASLRGTDNLGLYGCTSISQDNGAKTSRIGCTDHRADISRVLHAVNEQDCLEAPLLKFKAGL